MPVAEWLGWRGSLDDRRRERLGRIAAYHGILFEEPMRLIGLCSGKKCVQFLA